MPQANEHSDLLFDFGPKGLADEGSPVDWLPTESRPFDSQVSEALPALDLESTAPLPELVAPSESGKPAAGATAAAGGFWLDGDVLMCPCPECRAPMSVRLWLMIADCWNCGTSIELTEEQIRQAERVLQARESGADKPHDKRAAQPAGQPVDRRQPAAATPVVSQPRTRFRGEPPNVSQPAPLQPGRRPARSREPILPPALASQVREAPSNSAARTNRDDDRFGLLRGLFRDMPAWLISFIIHLALLMLLALIQRENDDEGPAITLSATVSRVVQHGGDTVVMKQTPEAKFDLPLPNKDDLADPKAREVLFAADQDARELRLDPDVLDVLPPVQTVKQRIGSADGIRHGFAARDPRLRVEMVTKEGGTTLTEAAVARALRWFQRHQHSDGSWRLHGFRSSGGCNCGNEGYLNDDTAGTSLALLPYLGAGQSHLVGIYKDEVSKGLRWLIRHQKPDGDLRVQHGNSGMYAHGQAAIVLCEAFAITGDEELRTPAQKAIDFIVAAQYDDGGWRYTPAPRSQQGDTSVVGWQLMALQSARAANLAVPEQTLSRAGQYLDRVQHGGGALYSYQQHGGPTPIMTAEGLLCRLYLGWNKDHPGLNDGIRFLLETHPPRRNELGIYYWYYATQAVHHYGGQEWDAWNRQMRDVLVETQHKEGHAAGSWSPMGQHSDAGGRVYQTALSACTLEVYYRHLPIFRRIKVDGR